MKKIISLIVLLLMIATVSAKTVEKEFETQLNVTLTHNDTICRYDIKSENNDFSDYTSSSETRSQTYTFKIKRNVEVEDIGGLENLTKVMEELVKVNLELAKYGNDSKTYQEKYNEKNEAWARVVENYDECKEDRDIYKNDSIQLGTCQSDLTNSNSIKNQCNSDLVKSNQDLEDQKAKTQTTGVVCILIGALGGYGFFWYKKEYAPAEKRSFQ